MAFILMLLTSSSFARLDIVQSQSQPLVFSGKGRQIELVLYNQSESDVETTIGMRVYQATSATLAPIGKQQEWKKLRMLAGQTALENATIDFPDVRSMTVFQVQWLMGEHTEIGRTTVSVVPTNILSQISILASNKVVGLADSENLLRPVLKESGVKVEEVDSFAGFPGNLALIGPSGDQQGIASGLKAHSKHPMTVLWIRHSTSPVGPVPNLYFVQIGQARVAVADAQLFADLDKSARAQVNLLRCIHAAQHPEELKLP